jgi:hypothetical protein
VVPANSKAATFDDLRGTRLSAGRTGTGTRETAEALFQVLNWTPEDRANLIDLPVSEQSAALCSGKVDAIAILMGHPSPLVTALADQCPVKLLTVSRDVAEQLSQKLLYYRPATISAGLYAGNPDPVATVGLRAAVVTTADVPARLVQRFTEAVFRNIGTVRDAAPAFADLRPDQMSTSGLIAPLHPGALEYFVAAGLPTPNVVITPNARTAIPESDIRAPANIVIDPKLQAPKPSAPSNAQKPAFNTVPVGPGDKWKLEAGDFGGNNPALTGDGDLPAAQDNIRLKIPAPK